jgi:hypothetical protein
VLNASTYEIMQIMQPTDKRSNEDQALNFNYHRVSQPVFRGPEVVLGFCPCGPLRLNISKKKKKPEKIKLT